MTGNTGKSNFIHGFTDASEEINAYREILDYLVRSGNYSDVTQADNDAKERVRFCDEMDLYADEPKLKDASVLQRKIQALIYANKLQYVIAENAGYLPGSSNNEAVKPAINVASSNIMPDPGPYPELDSEVALNDVIIKLDRSEHVVSKPEPAIEPVITAKQNAFLQISGFVSKALLIVFVLLASLKYFFSSEDALGIIKYSFFLFSVLMVLFAGLFEASGRLLLRLSYAVSYLSFLTAAALSGLLFLQPPWAVSTFYFHGGMTAVIVNFIIHTVMDIGPFWLGVFFGVVAFFLLIASWTAGRKIRQGLSETRQRRPR
jgi:hypothetical protein